MKNKIQEKGSQEQESEIKQIRESGKSLDLPGGRPTADMSPSQLVEEAELYIRKANAEGDDYGSAEWMARFVDIREMRDACYEEELEFLENLLSFGDSKTSIPLYCQRDLKVLDRIKELKERLRENEK